VSTAEQANRQRQAYVNRHGQGDINLVNLIERYGSEEKCRDYLEELRWPEGVTCPRCEGKSISRIKKRDQYDCNSCRYQFSVKSGTVFHDSHLPLWKWFLATYMMIEGKKGISANQLKRTLAVSYKTAWFLCHRIRHAMDIANPTLLKGTIEVDETYVGGKHRNRHKDTRTRGRTSGKLGKVAVLGAMERGGAVRFQIERRDPDAITLSAFVIDHVEENSTVYTDGHRGYKQLSKHGFDHEAVDHSAEEWVRADVHTNAIEGVWSILKRSIVGTFHQLSAKHLESYLDEIAFRFNNRNNPYLFRDTLLAMLDAETLTYAELIQKAQVPAGGQA
jgi:transposase-like protein